MNTKEDDTRQDLKTRIEVESASVGTSSPNAFGSPATFCYCRDLKEFSVKVKIHEQRFHDYEPLNKGRPRHSLITSRKFKRRKIKPSSSPQYSRNEVLTFTTIIRDSRKDSRRYLEDTLGDYSAADSLANIERKRRQKTVSKRMHNRRNCSSLPRRLFVPTSLSFSSL